MAEEYFIKVEGFEGPLDLLLYLVRVHELNIFNIDIKKLTNQYLNYLRLVKFRSLQQASSFLQMAASLCHLKVKMLLEEEINDELAFDDEDEMTAEDLQRRLIAHSTFQKAGEYFATRISAEKPWTSQGWKPMSKLLLEKEPGIKGDAFVLLILYEQLLSTLPERQPKKVTVFEESISLDEVSKKIKNYLLKLQGIIFQKLYTKISSRYELVAHIIAMLQLVRDGEAGINQEDFCGPIWLYEAGQEHKSMPNEGP